MQLSSRQNRLSCIVTLVLTVVCLSGRAVSIDAQEILSYDTPQTVSIGSDEQARLRFSAFPGTVISLSAMAQDDLVDPRLELINPDGTRLFQVDDISDADLNAAVEGITLNQTGLYTINVSAYGETSGDVTVLLTGGFLQDVSNRIDLAGSEAESIVTDGSGNSTLIDDVLVLQADGMLQGVVASTIADVSEDGSLVEADINVVQARNGWRAGFALPGQPGAAFVVNEQGQWGVLGTGDGNVTELRAWTRHPAIRVGERQFRLGMLIQPGRIELLVNRQSVGAYDISLIKDSASIAAFAGTPQQISSFAQVEFAGWHYSTRLEVDGASLPVVAVTANTADSIIAELQRNRLLPVISGTFVANITNSNMRESVYGMARRVIRDQQLDNYVLYASYNWQASASLTTGCGVSVVDAVDNNQYVFAYTDNLGGYGISQRQDDIFGPSEYYEDATATAMPHSLLLIVEGNTIRWFANNAYVSTFETSLPAGGSGQVIVNYDQALLNCFFNQYWVWQTDGSP